MKATDFKGPWKATTDLPDSFKALPDDGNWKEVKENLPGWKGNGAKAPRVFVSLVPAELILLTGPPTYLMVQGAKQLVWVSNTESDVFRMGATGTVYFLVSGRWFSSPGFNGPWTFATPTLPDDFKKIPLGHPRSRVLASVPGTTQAAEAVLLAQIPQTARVSKTLAAPAIVYQGGTPQFQPIEKTTVQTRGQHRQGRLQGRRSVLPVLPGRLVHVDDGGRAVAGHRRRAESDLHDSGELALLQRHLRHGAGVEQRRRGLRHGDGVHRDDGRVGLRGVGLGVLLSAVPRVLRRIPVLLPALSELRLPRVVQPVDRRVHARRVGVWTVWRRRRGAALQPDDRHLFTRRRGVRPVRRAGRGAGVQPADRHVRSDEAGLERVRQLGQHAGAARRSVGQHVADHEQRHGRDETHDRHERGVVRDA